MMMMKLIIFQITTIIPNKSLGRICRGVHQHQQQRVIQYGYRYEERERREEKQIGSRVAVAEKMWASNGEKKRNAE